MALATISSWLPRLTSSDISSSDIAAWWGATAATFVLGWNILRAARSKGRLKVEGTYQVDHRKSLPPVLSVRVTNLGSKPVLIQGIAIQLKRGSEPNHHFFPCQIPHMLARGKFFWQVLDRTGWLPTDTEKLYAWDSSGRHWRMARREFRSLLDQNRRFFHNPQLRSPSRNFPGVA